MLKRLIIAVFGIALVLAFGSLVLADTGKIGTLPNEDMSLHPNLNHPKVNVDAFDFHPAPAFKKPESAIRYLPNGFNNPTAPSLIYFCDGQYYFNPAVTTVGYWTMPDSYGDDLFNSRFTVEANFNCTLKVAYIGIISDAEVVGGPAGSWGTPDMRVYLWADDGFGFPGALLDSVDIPYASLPAFNYAAADFSASGWVFSDGDEYHYGYTTLGGLGDTIAILSDLADGPYAGEERSSEYWNGAWGSMLNDWGDDYAFLIISERCCSEIPFSDCYSQNYFEPANLQGLFRAPHPSWGDSAWAMRFDVGGPETLSSVDFMVFDGALVGFNDPSGDQDIHITVYDDDGFGFPGAMLAQNTVPAGTYPFYPAVTTTSFAPLVVENTFHVSFSTNGFWDGIAGDAPADNYETIASDNGLHGQGRGTAIGDPTYDYGPDAWYTMLYWWGADRNHAIAANLCRDEFSDCETQYYYAGGEAPERFYPMPEPGNNNPKWAQKFNNAPGGADCELRQLVLRFGRILAFDVGRPLMYTHDTYVRVAADAGGKPGGIIHTETLTPADYAAAGYTGAGFDGSFIITRNVNVAVPANFWVIIEPNTPLREEGIRYAINLLAGGGGLVDGMAVYDGTDLVWYFANSEYFGGPADGAMDTKAKVCCVPFTGRACAPAGDDWSVRSHDQARTGASQLAIGDAWCDLNFGWFQDDLDAAASAQTMGPIIYENRVYQVLETAAAGSTIRVFNLADGAPIGTISGADLGNFIENDPLIVNDKLYISGGDNRVVSRWDISGVGVPALPDWTATIGAAAGPLRRANLMLLNVAGTDVLFGGSQVGRAFAINESNGLNYPGWVTNPRTLDDGQLVQGSATDGTLLYFGTRQAGLNGDVWALDPATGVPVWKLSTAGGYQGATIYTDTASPVASEAFPQISTEAGVLYVGGRPTGNHPVDGLFYRLDATNGDVLSVDLANGPLFANPIIDVNLVYLPTTTGWVGPPLDGDLFAYDKGTGLLVWGDDDYFDGGADSRHFANALLTCEPEPAVDIIVAGNVRGVLTFVNSLDGSEYFRRRVDFGGGANSLIDGTAIGVDEFGATHVLAGTLRGALLDLQKGDDRPRLEIQEFTPQVAVEFSVSTSVIYTVPDILTNTGCAPLTFTAVNVDTASFGATDPLIAPPVVVRPGLFDAASDLANQLASSAKAFLFAKEAQVIDVADDQSIASMTEESYRNERGYRAALVLPVYLNGVVEPFAGQVVAQNDTIDLVLDVNSSNIKRGPQTFYIELDSDDPDYFLNAPSVALPNADPQLVVTLIGGCLTDSSTLEFGMGSANYQFVFNTGTLALPDDGGVPFGFAIDGDDDAHWMSTYLYGVSKRRIALSLSYFNGVWISWQGDPNWCDNDCKPALTTGVPLGAIWDGVSAYTPISGNMICASGVDSVQHFGSPTWDWDTPGPFNADSTMGLSVNTRTIGAVDEPTLANLTVEILEFSERNNRAVPGWKFGFWGDFDTYVNSPGTNKDTAQIDISHSAAWSTVVSGAGSAWGMIKLPYGCGYSPLKNARLLNSDNSFYSSALGSGGYLDSFYMYCSMGQGVTSMAAASTSRDQSLHVTLVERDVAASENFDFAIAQFGLHDLASTIGSVPEIRDLADLANKWVGFGRGDVNDDEAVNLGDIMMLADVVGGSVPGAIPFEHLGDVDADGDVDNADLNYLIAYYFDCGPCPLGDWQF